MKIVLQFLSIIFIVIFASALMALTLKGVWGNPVPADIKGNLDQAPKPLELSPERGRFLLTQNLVENHSFALTQEVADAASPDVGYHDGRYYVEFAPGISVLAMPLYSLGKAHDLSQLFTFSIISIITILNLIFLFLISKNIFKLSNPTSILVALIYGFGTIGWSYAITLYQHQATVFFILSSFYFVWQYRQKGILSFFWGLLAWISYGLSITVDYPNALFLLPIMIYFLVSALNFKEVDGKYKISLRLSIILSSIGFIVIAGGIGYFDNVNFGSPLRTSQTIAAYKTIQEGRVSTNSAQLQKQEASKGSFGSLFSETRIVFGGYELLIAKDKGIVLFSPIVLLGLIGIFLKRKHLKLEDGILISLVALNFLLYASFSDPYGGWAFGPRYLIISMSILSIFVGVFVERFKYPLISKLLTLSLFAYSAAIALLGALTTNAVPPETEADYLHMKYGWFYNVDFLSKGNSGSFLYNYFFRSQMSLEQYFLIILVSLIVLAYLLLSFTPWRIKQDES